MCVAGVPGLSWLFEEHCFSGSEVGAQNPKPAGF